MKNILKIMALIALVAISSLAQAQSFHAPNMRKAQKEHAKKHGKKLTFKKAKQSALYRDKRKSHKKQLYK